MLRELNTIITREGLHYTDYHLLRRSFGSDDAILDAIADAGSAKNLLRNVGLRPPRKKRGHIC